MYVQLLYNPLGLPDSDDAQQGPERIEKPEKHYGTWQEMEY